MSRRKEPAIPAYLLDQLLTGTNAATALDQGGLLDSLKKALAERALNAEMDHHLCGEAEAGNNRNGFGRKTVIADSGKTIRHVVNIMGRTRTCSPQGSMSGYATC